MNAVQRLASEIVQLVESAISTPNLKQKLNTIKTDPNFAAAIAAIITGTIKNTSQETKKKIMATAPQNAIENFIIKIISGTVQTSAEVKKQIVDLVPTDTLVTATIKIINDALKSGKNIKTVISANVRKNVHAALGSANSPGSSIVKLILDIIGNSTKGVLSKQTATKTVKLVGRPSSNSNSILKLIMNALKRNETPEKAKSIENELYKKTPSRNNTSNLIYKLMLNVFKNKLSISGKMVGPAPKPPGGKGKMVGPEMPPNFINANRNNQGNPVPPTGPKPGYIFTTRGNLTGWWRNNPPRQAPGAPGGEGGGVPRVPMNYSKMEIEELLRALRNNPENREVINREIRKKINSIRRNLRYESASRRARRLGELLRRVPRNFPGRRNITSEVIESLRGIRNSTELSNFISNLGSVPNENVRRAVAEQRRRLQSRRPYETENEHRRRVARRSPYETESEYRRRPLNINTLARRRTALEPPPRPSAPPSQERPFNLNALARRRSALEPPPAPRPYNSNEITSRQNSFEQPPPLPAPQQQAITNAGGIQKAVNTIAQVPGGAIEVAKAAEALNETGGNVSQAVNVKGVSPVAVRAVQNLGGARNTVSVLEGLNTLSQTASTRKRKQKRRRTKVIRPRIAELNRVIDAVKKQKLISLVAHNVTKTHNIHPNDEKLKKYYKKIIKANILRRPFAKIVKRAAKKNKS
jgi:hypothetical protein